jgi:hypothetical protein
VCCEHIHFLGSTRAADQWLREQPSGTVLALDEAWELGQMFADAVLAKLDAPEFRAEVTHGT